MREICYRGRCIKDDDMYGWVQGYYVCLEDIWKKRKTHRIYNGFAESDCGEFYADYYEVDPKTVGQFTGLTDKNDLKIFEGDIVKYYHGKKNYDLMMVVWYEEAAHFVLATSDDFYCCEPIMNSHMYCEVIGNIHDNPELLG